MQVFLDSGMTLKIKKCFFGRPRVRFLGHIVGSGYISVVPSKAEAIKVLPEPTTKKLLRGFLGMCGYYRSFLPCFSEIALPLTELTRGGHKGRISFDDSQRAAFVQLKDMLVSSTSLSSPVYDRPFLVQCDASDYAVGCCLAQLDDAGHERPLAFASAKFDDTQRRWSVLEKKAYAIVYAMKQFDHIIFGSRVELYTDYDPLQYIVNNSPKCMKLTRWALHLSRYDLKVHHKSGNLNINADCLSRLVI